MVDYNGHLALGIGLGIAAIGTVILGKIVTSEQVQTSSRNFVDSFSKTIVYGARSAVDYWRRDYRDRVNERMMEKLANKERDERKKHIHHIVAQNAPMAEPAKEILTEVGIKINSAPNLVKLTPLFHMRLHTNIYYGMINLEIKDAYYCVEIPCSRKGMVEKRLEEIKDYLKVMDGAW